MTKNELFSIRMRASKTGVRGNQIHISGAEGLHGNKEIPAIVTKYVNRALNHPRGNPDQVVITLEKIKKKPEPVTTLPVTTLICPSPARAKNFIRNMLKKCGISDDAAKTALKLLYTTASMRGASLILSSSGRRMEPDRDKGIRVSRIGISGNAARSLSDELRKQDIDNDTVKEALVIASKVLSCRQVIAELCISDDPEYTTGYMSSREAGYIRIPHIKTKNSGVGGRVFFIREGADIDSIINYLQKTPVIIESVLPCRGTSSADEIIHSHHL